MLLDEKDENAKVNTRTFLRSIKSITACLRGLSITRKRLRVLEDKDIEKEGKSTLWDGIKNYSVWIIGLITFGYWLAQTIGIGGCNVGL